MKGIPIGITIGIAALSAAVTLVVSDRITVSRLNDKLTALNEKQEFYSRLSEIDNYARSAYIGEFSEEQVKHGLIHGYVEGLGDRFGAYMTPEEYVEYSKIPEGMVDGLGFVYEKGRDGYISIKSVEAGGAAEEAGLQAGDTITAVNNTDVISFEGGYDEAAALLSCNAGTRVTLNIKRTDEYGTNFIDYDVIAKTTEHITVTESIVSENIGLIRIKEITKKTDKQFSEAIVKAVQGGAEGLVIDVRGLSFDNTEVLGAILNHVIGAEDTVLTEDRDGNTEAVITCTEAEQIKMPMAVLINEDTAGCGELLAAALKDLAGAKLVGMPTAGRGCYRRPYECSDGSVLLISTAYWYTPVTGKFNGTGLTPDERVEFPENIDLSQVPDMDAEFYDTQFIKAAELIKN